MAIQRRRSVAAAMALSTGIGMLVFVQVAPASADTGGVVISELNYHSGSDLDADDFLELTNTGAVSVDVSGWSFSAGVTGTLAAGTTIPAGGRFVVGKDAAQFQTTYGFAPDAVYGGNLSNSGETVTIVDAALALVDTVTYADAAPWPTSPDGTGPTLELRDLFSDNTLAVNWGASLAAKGTPRAVNSINGTGVPPAVTELAATPARPTATQAVAVTARLAVGSSATLTYKVMFGADVVVAFTDDAASPGGASDGVYAATIPAQSAGKLVRYRVDATLGGVGYSAPSAADSVRYRGFVVVSPAVTSQLPVIEWFMDDADYNDILANHRLDKKQAPAVWSYNGVVVDNTLMNVRGNSSRTLAKVNWKVELPKGYSFDLGGQLPYALDEFALQNYTDPIPDLGWSTVKAAGNRALNMIAVRTQRNGVFWSLGRLMETEDGAWRTDQGVSNWAIYKGDGGSIGRTASPAALAASLWLDKKTRKTEDFTDAWTLSNAIDAPASAAQQAWIYQNVNVPELVNYMATNAIIRHHDSGWYNWWLARDTEGTGRWEMWHWDLNWIFTTPADGKGLFLTPDTSNKFTQAMLKYPEIKEMYYRRLSTLSDQFLSPGKFEAQWDAIAAKTTPDWLLDRAKWGGYTPASGRAVMVDGLADRRSAIIGNTGAGKLVPASQSPNAAVVINEIQYHPAGTGGEFIELANPSTTAVDISGWTIDAVGLKIQPGTVVPAGGRVVFVANDKAFQAVYTGANRFVGGQFTGSLDDTGEAVVLHDGARIVDTVTYSNVAPWPVAADGTGPSLELASPLADNADAANWRATSTVGGTPGLANTPSGPVNAAPTAAFVSTTNGLAVAFDASGSTDSDGTIASYAWTFGDTAVGTGAKPSHTYAAAGTYTVTVTVTDNQGAKASVSHVVTPTAVVVQPGVLATDAFGRTATGGLGNADTGGAWTHQANASSFTVSGGMAQVKTVSGADQFGSLKGVSSTGTEVKVNVGFTRPTASSIYFGLIGRQVGSDFYGARIVVSSTGAVKLAAQRANVDYPSTTIAGLTYASGDRLQLRVQVVGTAPTTIKAKVWRVGATEPANWQVTMTDSTAALQSAGSVGFYSYLSQSGTPNPIVVSLDDFWAGQVG